MLLCIFCLKVLLNTASIVNLNSVAVALFKLTVLTVFFKLVTYVQQHTGAVFLLRITKLL